MIFLFLEISMLMFIFVNFFFRDLIKFKSIELRFLVIFVVFKVIKIMLIGMILGFVRFMK